MKLHAAAAPFVAFVLFVLLPDFYVKSASSQVLVCVGACLALLFTLLVGHSVRLHQPRPCISNCFVLCTPLLHFRSALCRLGY